MKDILEKKTTDGVKGGREKRKRDRSGGSTKFKGLGKNQKIKVLVKTERNL